MARRLCCAAGGRLQLSSSCYSRPYARLGVVHTLCCAVLQAPASQVGGLDSLKSFVDKRNYWLDAYGDKAHDMGSITDSHDIPRWLAEGNDDMSRYK